MNKKNLFILIISMLILMSISASASFTDEWGEFQDDPTNRGFVHDNAANFDDGLGLTFTDSTDGMSFQPLIVNMTGDSDLETIIYSGNFLQLYNSQMGLIDETNIGAIDGQPIIYNNGTSNIAVAIVDDVLEAWSYDGTSFIDNFANNSQLNVSWNCTAWIGLKCSGDVCYGVCNDVIAANTYIVEINMTSNNFINSSALSPNRINGTPGISDIDRDGNNELVFACDANSDNQWGLCVVDLSILDLDSGFSGDGILDNIGTGSTRFSSPVLWNIDGGGDIEILFTTTVGAGDDVSISVYNSDGSLEWFTEWTDGGTNLNWFSQPVIVDNGGASGQWDVCTSGTPNAGNTIHVLCTDNGGTQISIFSVAYSNDYPSSGFPMIAADMDSDGVDELIFSGGIIEVNGTIVVNTSSDNALFTSLADVNQDGELEIIQTNGSQTRIVYSGFTNEPPLLNNTYAFGGYGGNLDYTVPICVGTTLTFSAQECGGTATCNYDNDGSTDQERIVSNCGQLPSGAAGSSFTATLDNGTFSGANPSFACVYNITGIFSTRLFLQDNSNPSDFTQFNTQTITVQVINGTAGITCNLGSAVAPGTTATVAPSAQESQTNEAVESTLGILFGSGSGSDKLKLIVGVALILGIIAAAYREGVNSAVGVLVVAGFATLLVTMIGLITPAIFILGLALVLFILFIGRGITGGTPNGGI